MSFLLRTAQSVNGSLLLSESGTISTLSSCHFLDQRPEDTALGNLSYFNIIYPSVHPSIYNLFTLSIISSQLIDYNEWLPSVIERYDQLLLPVLRLLVNMLTTLPRNEDIAGQVLYSNHPICSFIDIGSAS